MKILLFTKSGCPLCFRTKEILRDKRLIYEEINCDEPEGLAEAMFNEVLAFPTVIIKNDQGREIARYVGEKAVEYAESLGGES